MGGREKGRERETRQRLVASARGQSHRGRESCSRGLEEGSCQREEACMGMGMTVSGHGNPLLSRHGGRKQCMAQQMLTSCRSPCSVWGRPGGAWGPGTADGWGRVLALTVPHCHLLPSTTLMGNWSRCTRDESSQLQLPGRTRCMRHMTWLAPGPTQRASFQGACRAVPFPSLKLVPYLWQEESSFGIQVHGEAVREKRRECPWTWTLFRQQPSALLYATSGRSVRTDLGTPSGSFHPPVREVLIEKHLEARHDVGLRRAR